MSAYGDQAYQYFKQGYNCSQSVAAAFASEMGLSEEQVMKMAVGFGGGVGRMREVCGAFSGLVLVLGTLYGSADPAQKTALYTEVQALAERFKDESGGSIICRELLGLSRPEGSPVASPRTETYYQKRPCAELCRLAGDLLAQYTAAHPLPAQTLEKNG